MTLRSRSNRCLTQPSPIPAEDLYPCASTGPCCPLPDPVSCPCQESDDSSLPMETPCCCKASMAEALRLLCDPTLASLVDFTSFFFLTDALTVGGPLTIPCPEDADNISCAEATFHRFSPCNCDLLDVTGKAYFAAPHNPPAIALEDTDRLSLCAVKAVAFRLITTSADTQVGTSNPYQQAIRTIRRNIQAEGGDACACGACTTHCDCDDCCCNDGILTELSIRNLSRLATLTAGPLILQNVTVLGSLGSVLVLADEGTNRFYLVCANSVEVLG